MSYFAAVVRPSARPWGYAFDLLCIVGGSLFLALMSQLSFNLWFTPVPITLQPFGVMLIGALLGSQRGTLAVLAYLIEGALGLPVFAGGAFGLITLLGPTGGYLFAFLASTFLIGALLERGWKESYILTFLAFILGSALMLLLGALWLACFVGLNHAFIMGVFPFLLTGAAKALAATALIPSGWKLLQLLK